MTRDVRDSIGGALVMAASSTFGDVAWANWVPGHDAVYGVTHGAVLFLILGWYLGARAGRPGTGAAGGAALGALGAGSFYVLAPAAGRSVMFIVWIGVWVGLGLLNGAVLYKGAGFRDAILRGSLAAAVSGVAFYAVSGIWFPFQPEGWDYAVHFGAWTMAYLPGLLALLVSRSRQV